MQRVRAMRTSGTYETVVGREDGVEGEHFRRRDVSMGGRHVTGRVSSGAPGGRVVKHDLSGTRVDVQRRAAVAAAGVRRTDAQHDAHLTDCITHSHRRHQCL